jgi:hypothetical protein
MSPAPTAPCAERDRGRSSGHRTPAPHPSLVLRFAGAAALLALLPNAAWAQSSNTRVSVTDTLQIEYRGDNRNTSTIDDNYGALINRLNLTGNAGNLASAIRVDSFGFQGADPQAYRNQARLERVNVRYGVGDFTLEFGDFYRQLGRGIVLSLRKVDEAGLDVSLQGGSVQYASDIQEIEVFVGRTNTSNIDAITQRYLDDVGDVLLGFDYALLAIAGAEAHVFGTYAEPEFSRFDESGSALQDLLLDREGESVRRDHAETGGISVELPAVTHWLSVYAEADYQTRDELNESTEGNAQYGTVDLHFGDNTILLEGTRISNMQQLASRNSVLGTPFLYATPPSLERFDQEVLNLNDYQGGRVRVERYFAGPDLSANANFMVRQTDPGADQTTRQLHGYAGFEWYYQDAQSRLVINGGYRTEDQTEVVEAELFKSLRHFDVDWLQHLGGVYALHLQSFNEFRTLSGDPFQRGSTLLGLERAGTGALSFEYGYDTTSGVEGTANFFYAGILQVILNSHFTLQSTVGTQRGGIKCINGICRNYPGFAGGSVVLISRW